MYTDDTWSDGDLDPADFERNASLLGIYKSFRTERLITKLKWQTRGGRLGHQTYQNKNCSADDNNMSIEAILMKY